MSIFISYRRGDTQAIVRFVKERLEQHFDDVFQDLASIEGGDVFDSRTIRALGSADVVLAVIGHDWLRGGSLQSSNDWVRRELEPVLARSNVVVILVLVDDAPLPQPEELPGSLQPLLSRKHCFWTPASTSTTTSPG